jgi:hypothetical protein
VGNDVNIGENAHVTLDELEADEWADNARRERLAGIRALAGQWTTSVGIIFALLGAGALVSSESAIQTLASPYSVAYGVLAAGTLVTAAYAVLAGSLASQGTVKTMPVDATEIVRLREEEFTRSARQLGQSRLAAGLAVVLLILSFGLRCYAPRVQPSKTSWTITKVGDGYEVHQR